MGQAIAVRTDYTSGQLRQLAKRAKDAARPAKAAPLAGFSDLRATTPKRASVPALRCASIRATRKLGRHCGERPCRASTANRFRPNFPCRDCKARRAP